MSKQKTKTLCNMAWDYPMFSLHNPAIGYCCRAHRETITKEHMALLGEDLFSNMPQFLERRKALLNGIKHSDCMTCWKLEDSGFDSMRNDGYFPQFMVKNKLPLLEHEEYRNVENAEYSNYTNVLEIILGNTCDAKCTYCNEFFSNQWQAERKKSNSLHPNFSASSMKRIPEIEALFWSWYKNKAINTIYRFGFIGGEPLIMDELYECLDKIIEIHDANPQKDRKVELCFTSNINTPEKYFNKFLEYSKRLEKHFKIIVQVSGEGYGEQFEYIRHGIKWDRWQKNIEGLLSAKNVTLNFLPCLSIMSIKSFNQYLKYWESLCLKYGLFPIHENIVTWPQSQSPMIAPPEFAKYFDEPIEIMERMVKKDQDYVTKNSYVSFLHFLQKTKDAISQNDKKSEIEKNKDARMLYSFFSDLDSKRGTSFVKTFPELEPMYNRGRDAQ